MLSIVALGSGELAGDLTRQGLSRLDDPRLPRSLVRAGSMAGSMVVGEIVGAVVLTELEELLYRDAVAVELEATWSEASQRWAAEVHASYVVSLAQEEAALLDWTERTWPTLL